ncbi:diguanylate cyclase domain-containing protein [Niallia circulans]|uniref:sensor domain-containing diguanylate cyclase n=1 Tax=Niallia circulans TaxID=1397 RepID=UPI001F44253C|nr:diguanylate cyclase [Niallia circulans]MCF2650751.1 sensor domain-containing diguanylate cyclase [Niallia circulans]
MDFLGHQKILILKSRFFELYDIKLINDDYDIIIQEALQAIKEVFGAVEVTLYTSEEWDLNWSIVSTTASRDDLGKNTCIKENLQLASGYKFFRLPITEDTIHDYMMLALKSKEKLDYILAIKIKKELLDEPNGEISLFDMVAKEVGILFRNMQNMLNVNRDKKKYKQLFKVTEKFHSSMKMEDVLREVIFTLKKVYPSYHYYLLLSHDNNSPMDLPVKDLEYDSENMAAMEAYVTAELQFENLKEEKSSVIYAPLKGKQGVYGVLQIIVPDVSSFPKNEVEFISLLANTAGGALENAQLYQQSKKLVTDLQLINEASDQLNSNLRLNEMMTYICERISASFNAKEVGFILFSIENDSTKVLQGSSSFFFEPESKNYIDYFKEKIQMEKDSLFLGDFSMQLEDVRYKSVMAVPMMQTGILKGFAIVMHPDAYHFSFDTFKLLQSLIHHSTLALTNSLLREELEKMVVTDHLTKLFSRSYLDEKIQRSLIEDKEGTFILIDIDDFKLINDTYGHQIGDDIIIQVANIIKENIRSSDVGSRWGGEELAIYLPKVTLSLGVTIAERLVKKVRDYSKPSVTISCGVSYWNKQTNDTYNTLFKRADKALYIAKETGKDKVVIQNTLLVSE